MHVLAYLLKWRPQQLFAQAGLECDPPDLYLPSSWNYRFEPQCPASKYSFNRKKLS
jgi:hypothetical protein